MSKRKYKPVYTINSLGEFEIDESKWYQVNHSGRKMWHRSALESLQTRTLMNWIKRGDIQACKKIEELEKKEQKPLSPIEQYWAKELIRFIDAPHPFAEKKEKEVSNGL